jgi:HlyD family secretion protein
LRTRPDKASAKQHLAVQHRYSLSLSPWRSPLSLGIQFLVAGSLLALSGCGLFSETEAGAQPRTPGAERGGGTTPVEVAVARPGTLGEPLNYVGTTQPIREVAVRSQIEGRLLALQVGVGDRVSQGQIIARLDDSLLLTTVNQAESELATLTSEVARAQTQVNNAKAQAARAQAELQQAQVDAERLRSLAASGAISRQQAELAQTAAVTAQQNLNAANSQIATEQQAVAAAQGRVAAQRATLAQAKERQSYALLASPLNGVVLQKTSEPGNLIQPGGEIIKIGDFSRVKVVVPVSELGVGELQVGQSVQVSLDALKDEEFSGQITRISPVADNTTRQLPVEVTIANPNARIGSGLLARVSFGGSKTARVVVPQSALQEGRGQGSREAETEASQQQTPSSSTVFVVTGNGQEAKVEARSVQVGTRTNNKVEILEGLQPGERFVAQSGKPLKDGESVRLSVLSEES